MARWLTVVVLLACTFAWRLPASPTEWRFTLCENDSFYQLHRVQQCLRDFPYVESVEPYSHFPRGYRVPWAPLHTAVYASLVRSAGIAPDATEEIVGLVSWVPPLAALLALLLVLDITRCMTRSELCVVAVGVLYAFHSDASRAFVYGTIDHHLFAVLGVLLMVWGRLRQRLAGWVAGATALLAMTPEAIIFVTLLLGCLFASLLAEDLTTDAADVRERDAMTWAWFLSPAAVSLATWLAGRALEIHPLPVLDVTWMYPTVFTPLWLAILGGSMLAVLRALAPLTPARAVLGIVLVGGAAAAWLAATGALQTAVTRFLGGGGRMFVAEEASVFRQGFFNAPAGYRIMAFALPWVVFALLAALRRDAELVPERRATFWFAWLVLALSLVLGFAEYRHLYVLAPLQLVALGLALFGVEALLRAMPMFARLRWVPALVLAAGTVPFFVREDLLGRADASSSVCAPMPLLEDLSTWLANHTPPPGEPPTYGVFGAWSIGHHLHVLANRPVTVDPFNYDLEDWVGTAMQRVLQAHTAAELTTALRDYRVRYLVLTNPWAEIVDTLGPAGPMRDDLVEMEPGGKISFKPGLAQFASFRLFMNGGATAEFPDLELRYATSDSEHYMASSSTGSGEPQPVLIPRGQIYEVKPAP